MFFLNGNRKWYPAVAQIGNELFLKNLDGFVMFPHFCLIDQNTLLFEPKNKRAKYGWILDVLPPTELRYITEIHGKKYIFNSYGEI